MIVPKNKEKIFSRKLDTYLGIPTLFALTGFSPLRELNIPDIITTVAFLKMDSIRDTIFIKSAIKSVKRKYPNCTVTFFAGPENYEILSTIDEVDNVVAIYPFNIRKSMAIVASKDNYDIWIDCGIWSKYEALLTHVANASLKLGFKYKNQYRHFCYDKYIDFSTDIHYIDNLNYLLNLININIKYSPIIPREAINEDKYIICNMFVDNEQQKNRLWSEDKWLDLIKRLVSKGYRVAIIGSKENIPAAEKFIEDLGEDTDVDYLVGRLNIDELIHTLLSASLLISSDTGVFHLAANLGVKVLGIYGPTSEICYKPLSSNSRVITANINCLGCQDIYSDESCRSDSNRCMKLIDVNMLESEVYDMLGNM